jgi:hypothetical protein
MNRSVVYFLTSETEVFKYYFATGQPGILCVIPYRDERFLCSAQFPDQLWGPPKWLLGIFYQGCECDL